MTFRRIIPEIYANNLQETVEYYTNILQFQCVTENSDFYAILKKENVEIMISFPNSHLPFEKTQFTGSLMIEVDDIDSYWKSINQFCDIIYPIQDFEYGLREFAFYDINKIIIRIIKNI